MRAVLLVAFALAVSPADALASPACSGPWYASYGITGCPFEVVQRDGYAGPVTAELHRNGEVVADAVVEIVMTNLYLDVDYYDITCGTYDVQYVQSEPFVHYSIGAPGAQSGDEVVITGLWPYGDTRVLLQDGGQCPVLWQPNPECYATTNECPSDPIEDPPEDDDGDLDIGVGCSTSHGSAGLPLLLALAALLRRRRLA